MPLPFPQSGLLSDEISLQLPDSGIIIDKFTAYSFNSDFLGPTDCWHFVTGGQNLNPAVRSALRGGARVILSINGHTQGGGYIKTVDWHADHSGLIYNIVGYDSFGPVVDSGADPQLFQFDATQTLEDAVRQIFERFSANGWLAEFDISNDANRSVMTGIRTTTKKGRALKATKLAQQIKPYPGEGCFDFLTRFLHRFGLWCWPSADQTTVIVGQPAYDSPVMGKLVRRKDGSGSNIIGGGIREDTSDQPSAICAFGASQGGDYSRAALSCILINELTGLVVSRDEVPTLGISYNAQTGETTDLTAIATTLSPTGANIGLLSRYPRAQYIPPRTLFSAYLGTLGREDPISRPMFLEDDEAKTLDQLVRFAYKELSLRQQRMWTGTYYVEGHTQGGHPWAPDTIVMVDDDEGNGFHGPMYVRGRTFEKGTTEGTRTKLDLILPGTIDFGGSVAGDYQAPATRAPATANAAVAPGTFNVTDPRNLF